MQVELIDNMGSDLTVVNAARVSFNKHSDSMTKKDERLINYLASHGHWTPFAHCFLQFRIKAPLYVARQLMKHQIGLVWNEVSRRYVDSEPELYNSQVWRGRPTNSKQGSEGTVKGQGTADLLMETVHHLALKNYNEMIEMGVAPEQARSLLPQSMMTEWYWSGSLHAFARVVKQRTSSDSQLETQEVADVIGWHCHKHYPKAWTALMN